MNEHGRVVAVHLCEQHEFSKRTVGRIVLREGLGVEGDAHAGATVQHRSRVAKDPSQPNLRQVHLLHGELFDRLAGRGHVVVPGELGENVTTRGIDLLALPVGTRLRLGGYAVVTITGLRNPCAQIERFQTGLLGELAYRAQDPETGKSELGCLAGVMATVSRSGSVVPGIGSASNCRPSPTSGSRASDTRGAGPGQGMLANGRLKVDR